MKISKTLLNTILVAATVGTISSCTKNDDNLEKQKEAEKEKTEKVTDACPACGMG